MKAKRLRARVRIVLLIFFLIVFLVSGAILLSQMLREHKESKAFDDLATQVQQSEEQPKTQAPKQPQEVTGEPQILPAYAELYEQNHDLFGWVEIEGTTVNYPVMFTPDDPQHYLRRAFDGSDAHSGVPFLDGAYTEECRHYLIYGHNMKNDTMFSPILSYADETFWKEHPRIRFDTLYEAGQYEVLAAFHSQIYPDNAENVFRYYECIDLSDRQAFEDYIRQAKEASFYDTGVDAAYGDTILTLSTCSYDTGNGRFAVVARKIEE